MKNWMKNTSTALVCSLCLAACGATLPVTAPNGTEPGEVERTVALIGPDWPATRESLATTDGEIYMGNLNGQIELIENHPRLSGMTRFQVTLAGLLYQRFQIEGRIADAERARSVLERAQGSPQFGPADRLMFAQVLQGFHDFEATARQIDLAEAAGADSARVLAARRALQRALDLPAPYPGSTAQPPGDYVDAVRRASVMLEQGRLVAASAMLRLAQNVYRDSNPFPLAWIHVQQGIAFLRHGEYEYAQRFFSAAHERLPQYYLATEHLAETEGLLGNAERSAELYRLVTAQNDQPAFWHGLAQAQAALGEQRAAQEAAIRAASAYARLLAEHPLMFADHAVAYYLDVGEPATALELATLNHAHRQDIAARLALAEALLEAGDDRAACAEVSAIRAAGFSPPEISISGEPLAACGEVTGRFGNAMVQVPGTLAEGHAEPTYSEQKHHE